MLTTLLDRLGSLVSRQFVVAYFIPVLVFALLNALLLGWRSEAFRAWAPAQFEGFKGLYAFPVLFGLSVIAYLLFSANVYLRQVLEGRRLLPDAILKTVAAGERDRHERLLREHEHARDQFYAVAEAKPQWREELSAASDKGHARPQDGAEYGENSPAPQKLAQLRAKYGRAEPILKTEVDEAVDALSRVLELIDRTAEREAARRLQSDHDYILELLDYAERSWDARRIAALNRLDMEFGQGEPRATRMGNVAASLEGYAQTRYRMNLDTFWNRMQPVLLTNEKFYGMLLDAKMQLDFLVVCCWLCIFTAVGWMMAMPWVPFSWPFFLTVSLLAPLLARFFYRLAVENYLVFADVVKSAVDLFRFQLLKSLRVPTPTGIRQERELWASLQDLSTFGKEGLEMSYQHDDK